MFSPLTAWFPGGATIFQPSICWLRPLTEPDLRIFRIRLFRQVHLFFEDSFWYLRGYCRLREEFRTFALDQIRSLKILSEHFVPENISPEEELSGTFGTFVNGEPVEVVLCFQPEIKSQVLRKKWHPRQKEKPLKNGSLELKFTVNGWDGIKPRIYRWLPWVTVVSPKELKELVKKEITQALSQDPQ